MMKNEPMLRGYDQFSQRMMNRYNQVRDCLAAERYDEAQLLLTEIALIHAQTSLSLRNVLVKSGKLRK